MASRLDVSLIAKDPVLAPRGDVSNSRLDDQLTSRAKVLFDGVDRSDGLYRPDAISAGLCAAHPDGQSIDVEGFVRLIPLGGSTTCHASSLERVTQRSG